LKKLFLFASKGCEFFIPLVFYFLFPLFLHFNILRVKRSSLALHTFRTKVQYNENLKFTKL